MKYYKYVTPAGLDILINNRIKVSDFSVSNDPFEIFPRIDYPVDETFWDHEFSHHVENDPIFEPAKRAQHDNPDEYERQRRAFICRSISQREHGMRDIPHRLRAGYAQVVGFVCLTTKPDDIVMWGHYTDCHKGLVVEFDGDNVFFVNFVDTQGNKLRVFPVDYRDNRPVLKVGQPFRPELMACKSKVWEYEKEIRVLFHKSFCQQEGDHFYFPVSPACVTGVILGARVSEDLRRQVHSLNHSKWNDNLTISKAVEDIEEYKMVIREDR